MIYFSLPFNNFFSAFRSISIRSISSGGVVPKSFSNISRSSGPARFSNSSIHFFVSITVPSAGLDPSRAD